ncbi:MAG TPA: M1 family aminopeptidase, partial [Gemmatimonadales bacterium]|nr:M1 family aminopeptidase [Gemmatimonadales bacterium]
SVLASPISAAALVFTDSTLAELTRQLTFSAGTVPDGAADVLHDALGRLVDTHAREIEQPTLMTALLNGQTNEFFYSHVKREQGEDLMFVVDPYEEEPIMLLREHGQGVQIVSQFSGADSTRDTTSDPLKLEGYTLETKIGENVEFSSTARVRVTARRDGARWARFLLYPELQVDSLRDEAGTPDSFFRAKGSEELWLRFDAPLHAGETRAIRIAYHGAVLGYQSLMDDLRAEAGRNGVSSLRLPPELDKWFYVKSPQTWFPRYARENPRYAAWAASDMDLTFHTPKKYHFVSVGRLVDSHVDGNVQTTHWVTERPASEVCFNMGDFDELNITDPRIPPVTVQTNTEAHRALDEFYIHGQANPDRDVGGDVANSLAFFTRVFGPPLFQRYYATEIPFFYGQAFPGLMYLSIGTFQTIEQNGNEEAFRAHEMAHQWWGIGVAPAGYRDTWLSEGFAEFSGLWYMQSILRDNDKFFKQLRDRRHDILARRDAAPPIALGWRVARVGNPGDYSLIVYGKGAWVLHMLRNLMLDLHTMKDDAFTAMMQDFYQQYRGRTASTQDFQKVVEHHTGLGMDWFFNEWVNGSAIPTYTLSWHADSPQNGQHLLHIRVRQEHVPSDFIMPVPIRIDFADSSQAFVRVNVKGTATEGTLHLPAEPIAVELNPFESVLAEVKTEGWH